MVDTAQDEKTPAVPDQEAPSASDRLAEVADTSKAETAKVVTEAKEQARSVADTTRSEGAVVLAGAKEGARSVIDTTKSEAAVVVEQAKDQALDLIAEAKAQLRGQAENQAANAADALGSLARQFSAMVEGAQAKGEEGVVVELARQAADRTERMAERVDEGGIDVIVSDLRRLAQERPGLFLLGIAGAGFAVGRLAKTVDTEPITQAAGGGARSLGTGQSAHAGQASPAIAESETNGGTSPGSDRAERPLRVPRMTGRFEDLAVRESS